jgi:hypothetical protein
MKRGRCHGAMWYLSVILLSDHNTLNPSIPHQALLNTVVCIVVEHTVHNISKSMSE